MDAHKSAKKSCSSKRNSSPSNLTSPPPHPSRYRTIKAAASARHHPEPIRAPLPIGNMRDAAAVHTTMSPQPKGLPPAAKLGIVVAAPAPGPLPAQAREHSTLLPNKTRGKEGHLSCVAALAGLHISEAEPASETFKTMVRHCRQARVVGRRLCVY
jgi:hypothetical protein